MPTKKIQLDLENCYGIRSLKREFDFSNCNVYAIYAPNGAMKTSLAQTFKDVADGRESVDRIFPERVSKREIINDVGVDLQKENIFVVSPYDEEFGLTEKTSTLLVDSSLRKEYETIHEDINRSKQQFLQILKEHSGSKKDLEKEISSAFTRQDDRFYDALIRIKSEVATQKDAPFAHIRYDLIFDDRTLNFLNTQDFKIAVKDYVEKYNELLDASTFFSRETFNWYNASTIAKSLASNGFFEAKHTVNLNADSRVEISSQQELEAIITKEKESISSDNDLRKKFAEIEKLLTKNAHLREFQDYLAENEVLLPRLENVDSLKEDIWKSYFKAKSDLYENLVSEYEKMQERKKEIEMEANKQRTQWEYVIDIFNSRFFVPFRLVLENRERVILGSDPIPRLGFVFQEDGGGGEAGVAKDTLMKTLSTGEKKALYILNIIFEIEARRKANQETLLIFDDIADSFDYRNKYAIIQYLMDIADMLNFKQILLTHNFDFFRTVNSRFVGYKQCLMAAKTSTELSIKQAAGIRNPFVKDWKQSFFDDPKKRVASIPFLRNLIEYTKGTDDADFIALTSLLHWKSNSASFLQGKLDDIYNQMFGTQGRSEDKEEPVICVIEKAAKSCMNCNQEGNSINFENKIVLSIAIRIAAERFMVEKINDQAFVDSIESNQSQELLKRFTQDFADEESNAVDVIKRVVLMTPENIHLNSFMYEPILDMSDEHLKKLYSEVQDLNP